MLFDIFYDKCVIDNLELIKKDKALFEKYEKLEKQLEENPYLYNTKKPENIKFCNSVQEQFYYAELSDNVRIFYRICEHDSSVEIYMIDFVNIKNKGL